MIHTSTIQCVYNALLFLMLDTLIPPTPFDLREKRLYLNDNNNDYHSK